MSTDSVGTAPSAIAGARKSYLSRFVLDAVKQAPATLFMAVFSILIAAYYTRVFPAEKYGIYSAAIAFSGPIVTLMTEWVAQPIGRMYSEYRFRNQMPVFWQSINVFSSGALALFLFGAVVVWQILPDGTKGIYRNIYLETSAVIVLQAMTSILLPIFPASFNTHLFRRLTLLTALCSAGIAIALILLFGKNIEFLIVGQAISLAIFLPLAIHWSGWQRPTLQGMQSVRLWHTLRRMAVYGLPMMLWFLSSSLLDLGDRYVIQWFRGSAEVGIYSVNYSLMAGIVMLINVPVGVVLGPLLFEQWSRRDLAGTTKTLGQMTTLYVVIACALLGAGALASEPLVRLLLGKEFHVGQSFLVPILLARAVWGASMIGQKSLELREKTRTMMVVAVLSALLNLLLNLWLVPRYGYIAAAYTTLVSYIFYTGLIYAETRSVVPWTIDRGPALTAMVAALGAYALAALASRTWAPVLILTAGSLLFIILFGTLFLSMSRATRTAVKQYLQ